MSAEEYNEGGFEQTAMVVHGPVRREEGMQESDLLDQLPDGEVEKGTGTDHVMLVSLGCFCGPKLSFKHIGRGSETLPFDWMRTRHVGLIHFLRNDFADFFNFATKKSVPACNMTTYRSYYHSFWHDDPTDPSMRERYQRRIKRFNEIDARVQPVLFVRCIPTTDELHDVPELLEELIRRHGKFACLLLIIDFQVTARGAAVVKGYDNLLVYYLSGDHHVGPDGNPTPPYCKPVQCALDWVVGKPIEAMKFEDMERIQACADETHWGAQGLGGLCAFEASPEAPEEEPVLGSSRGPCLPLEPSAVLERGLLAGLQTEALAEAAVVPLGCSGLTTLSLQRLGCYVGQLPFDWTMVSHEGLLHFLRKGFEAPIRNGLGAGGQRPAETHGFFDFATRKRVPGSNLTMCRSHLHSFWHDDLADPEVREAYRSRIERFESLAGTGKSLLFVRSVATTAELLRVDELLTALTRKFGPQTCLLVIAEDQASHAGPYVVEGCDDLMVHFLSGTDQVGDIAGGSYAQAVECALKWIRGDPLEAQSVPDLRTLHSRADETSWGLVGLGGLNAFEGALRTSEDPGSKPAAPSAEDAWLEEAKMEAAKESVAIISVGSNPSTAAALSMIGVAPEGVIDCPLASGGPQDSQAAHESIDQFLGWLRKSDRPKLFVYAVDLVEDLGGLEGCIAALQSKFSGQTCLLVIVWGQPQTRLLSVEGHYDILVHFLSANPSADADGAAFREPIRQSLNWVVGQPVQASVVKDFESLQALAVH